VGLGDPDRRAEPRRLDEHRVGEGVSIGVAGAQRHVARDRDAAVAEDGLEEILVHRERRGGHAGADVGDAGELEQPLHRPVLAEVARGAAGRRRRRRRASRRLSDREGRRSASSPPTRPSELTGSQDQLRSISIVETSRKVRRAPRRRCVPIRARRRDHSSGRPHRNRRAPRQACRGRRSRGGRADVERVPVVVRWSLVAARSSIAVDGVAVARCRGAAVKEWSVEAAGVVVARRRRRRGAWSSLAGRRCGAAGVVVVVAWSSASGVVVSS
jgi:hypothetical protein